jgi:single-strand DNA-binding protein
MTLPRISLEGALVRDPEVRFTGTGKAVTNLTVACRDRVRGPNGEWTDGDATFVDVTVWGKPAENVCESARQGDLLVITGTLKQEKWEKEGETRSKLAVTAEHIGVGLLWNDAKTPRALGEYTPKAAATASAGDDQPPF